MAGSIVVLLLGWPLSRIFQKRGGIPFFLFSFFDFLQKKVDLLKKVKFAAKADKRSAKPCSRE